MPKKRTRARPYASRGTAAERAQSQRAKVGACVRLDVGTANPWWLTLDEARAFCGELTRCVMQIEAEEIAARNRPPEPPEASAAALPAA